MAAVVVIAVLFLATVCRDSAGQCAPDTNPFIGGALTFENLLLFDGGVRFTNASGVVRISGIPADNETTSATRCRYEFVGPVASSRVQLRVTRSTLGNNSIVTLHDGEGNPFAPAIGAFFGQEETLPAVLNRSGLSGFGLPSYYASSTNKVGLFVLRSDGEIDVELLYLISETDQTAVVGDKLDGVLIDESTSGVMVVTTFVLSALRLIGYAMRHL